MPRTQTLITIVLAGVAACVATAQTPDAATAPGAGPSTAPGNAAPTTTTSTPTSGEPNRGSDRREGGRREERNASSTPTNAARPAPPANEYAERFAIVSDLNMFVRERVRRSPPTNGGSTSRPAQPPPSPESVLVLRGVVLEEGLFRAYFENTQANEIVRVAAGEPLARGNVVEISIDAVAFERDGALVWVRVGDNLVGARVGAGPVAGSAANPATPGAGTSTAAPGSTEEAMRLRRMQSSGRAPQ